MDYLEMINAQANLTAIIHALKLSIAEVKEKLGRYLTIGIDSEFLTEQSIQKLDDLLVKNTGHAQLRIELKNGEDRVVLPSSERNKIAVTKEIQTEIEAIPGVYSIALSSR
jgi:hypothetical protein